MQVTVRTRGDDTEREELVQRNIVIELDKGGGGTRRVELPEEAVRGKTYSEVAHIAIEQLGADPWAADFEALVQDHNSSMERVSSGSQSHYVAKDAPFETSAVQDTYRLSVARDHTGG